MSRPIREITRDDIIKRYKQIQVGISKRAAQPLKANPRGQADAQKAMRYLSAIMNSYSGDKLNGEPLLPDGNPVLVLKDKRARKTLKSRDRFLEREERRDLYHHLCIVNHREYAGSLKTSQADFIALLMVTGLRQTEARTLKWSDIETDTYTIQDTKNNKPHTLPKTEMVRAIFKRNANSTQWVFPGKNGA
ncbi:MAG: tyrosine-type recombinase/integrase, partial [Pseudomonadales bacterium]